MRTKIEQIQDKQVLEQMAEQIAESYINGNISHCREQIKNDGILAVLVSAYVLGQQGESGLNVFVNRMSV